MPLEVKLTHKIFLTKYQVVLFFWYSQWNSNHFIFALCHEDKYSLLTLKNRDGEAEAGFLHISACFSCMFSFLFFFPNDVPILLGN